MAAPVQLKLCFGSRFNGGLRLGSINAKALGSIWLKPVQ